MDYTNNLLCKNLTVNDGRLFFAGVDTVQLAEKYGTPLYVMDEERIRERCRCYTNAVNKVFGGRAEILYASKAASFKRIYKIIAEEGMGADVVSSGEIYTARAAGFPLEKAYFHSNNKTDEDIAYAIDNSVGYFVTDNREELEAVGSIASAKGKTQKILLRLTPGIDPHTYAAISTGKVDSKFGSAIETGQAEEIARLALKTKGVELCGFHCHVGSQVFDSSVYLAAAEVMLDFIADFYAKTGYLAKKLDMGGGYGVRYTAADPVIDIAANIAEVVEFMLKRAASLGI